MCDHSSSEIRRRTFVDGTVHYGRQCVSCLASVPMDDGRTWIAHVEVTGTPPEWVTHDDGQRSLFDDEATR